MNVHRHALKVIEDAADLIKAGWCKGVSHQVRVTGHQYCLVGALCQASEGKGIAVDRVARTAAWAELKGGWETLPQFNDDPETTKQDVLDLLDRAAASMRRCM